MSDDNAIEEALHAYHGVEDRGHNWEWSQESLTGMRAAFAVFKRHQAIEELVQMELRRDERFPRAVWGSEVEEVEG